MAKAQRRAKQREDTRGIATRGSDFHCREKSSPKEPLAREGNEFVSTKDNRVVD